MGARLRKAGILVLALIASLVVVPGTADAAPARYNEYYHYFDTGNAQIPYHDTRWVPQGLTKLGENRLVIAYYDRYHLYNSIITIIDRGTGKYVKTLHLDTKSHVGGLAMTKKFFWVTSEGYARRYDRNALAKASGKTIYQQTAIPVRGSASYAVAEGETLWVGTFNEKHRDYMYQYAVGATGALAFRQSRLTPSQVQGVVVTSTRFVWSQSWGRDNDSKLIVWPRSKVYNGSGSIGNWVTAPNMAEGMVIAGGQLQVVFESGSDAYNGTADGNSADYIIRSVHHGSMPSLP